MHFLFLSGVNLNTPRTYKKVVGGRQTETVEAYRSGRISLRGAAEKYGVKKSTLYDHVKSKCTKRQDRQPIINEETERLFVERLIACAEWGIHSWLLI